MDRRRFLALASAVVTAGCGEYDDPANIWPEPADALGFFLKARNLTYGAEIGNAGGRGRITAILVDTTDLGDTRELGRKSVTLPVQGTVDVLFRAPETFETFRVDVSTPIVQ
jgi:hypothetical protein